ncbi:hypothetical protein Tco_0079195 [Tanacetum coccineum]
MKDVYPVFVDPEISTQADGAQSSRVPVPLPEDPYEAIRQAYLDGTDIESEPTKDPVETETPESPLTVAIPASLPKSNTLTLVPILRRTARMAIRVPLAMSSGLSTSMAEEDEEIEESLDYDSMSEDAEDEGPTAKDEDPATGDEGLAAEDEGLGLGVESCGSDDESRGLDDEGHSVESDGLGLREEEEAVAEGQQQAVLIVETADSGSAPESERPEWVSASRHPTLTTWTDPEDGMVYIDVPAYPPPAPPRTPVATPATAETEGFLTELGAQVEMQRGLIRDHARATCAWPLSDTHGERTRSCWVTAAEERQARYMLAKNIATEGG